MSLGRLPGTVADRGAPSMPQRKAVIVDKADSLAKAPIASAAQGAPWATFRRFRLWKAGGPTGRLGPVLRPALSVQRGGERTRGPPGSGRRSKQRRPACSQARRDDSPPPPPRRCDKQSRRRTFIRPPRRVAPGRRSLNSHGSREEAPGTA
jgi:hypothetical protein